MYMWCGFNCYAGMSKLIWITWKESEIVWAVNWETWQQRRRWVWGQNGGGILLFQPFFALNPQCHLQELHDGMLNQLEMVSSSSLYSTYLCPPTSYTSSFHHTLLTIHTPHHPCTHLTMQSPPHMLPSLQTLLTCHRSPKSYRVQRRRRNLRRTLPPMLVNNLSPSPIALHSYTQICERIWCPTALCPVGRRDPGVWGSHSCTGAAARVKGGRSVSSEGRTAGVWAEDPGVWGGIGEGHKEDGGAAGVGL